MEIKLFMAEGYQCEREAEEALYGDDGPGQIEVAESSLEAYSRKDEGPVQTEAESSMSLPGYAPK